MSSAATQNDKAIMNTLVDAYMEHQAEKIKKYWFEWDMQMLNGTEQRRTLRAVGQKVFIRPDKVEEKTLTGIFLTPVYQPPPCSGVVVSCGPGRYNRRGIFVPVDLKPGDRVSFRWIDAEQVNSSVKWNGEELKVLDADQLVGIVE